MTDVKKALEELDAIQKHKQLKAELVETIDMLFGVEAHEVILVYIAEGKTEDNSRVGMFAGSSRKGLYVMLSSFLLTVYNKGVTDGLHPKMPLGKWLTDILQPALLSTSEDIRKHNKDAL